MLVYNGGLTTCSSSFNRCANPGCRVFDIYVEGDAILNFDVAARSGGLYTAIEQTFQVFVSDGAISISFGNKVEDPKLSAIRATKVGRLLSLR